MTSATSPAAPTHINADMRKPAPQHIKDHTPASSTAPDALGTLPTPHQPPPPYIDPALLSALVYQLDYYFSPANLYSDTFLLSQMDATRAVPVTTIASFRKVQQLTADLPTVVAAMYHCSNLIVDSSATCVRPASISNVQRTTVVLRDVPNEVEEAEVAAIFGRAGCPGAPVSFYCDAAGEWSCVMENEEVCVDAALWLTSQSLRDQPIKARVKSDAVKPLPTVQFDGSYGGYASYPYNPYAQQQMYGGGMMDYNGAVYGGAMYNPYLTQQPGMPYMAPHSNGIDYHIPLPAGTSVAYKKGEIGAEAGEVQAAPGTGKKSKKKKSKAAKAAAAAAASALAAGTAATATASAAAAATSVFAPVTPSAATSSTPAAAAAPSVSSAAAAAAAASPAPSSAPAIPSTSTSHINIPLIAPSSYASKSEQHRPVSVFNHLPTSSIVTAAAFPPISAMSASSTSPHPHSLPTAISAPSSPSTSISAASLLPSTASSTAVSSSSATAGVKAPVLLNYASKVGSMSAAEVAKVAAAAKAAREAKLKADLHQPHAQQEKSVEESSETQQTSNSNKENTHAENAPPTPVRPSSATAHREGMWVKRDTSGTANGVSSAASTSPSWRERSREYPKRIHAPHPQRFAGYAGRQFGHAGQSPASSTSASSTASSSSSPSSPSSSTSSLSVSTPTPEAKRPFSYAELIKRASVSPSPTHPTASTSKTTAAPMFTGNGPISPLRHIPPLHPASVAVGQAVSMGAPVSPAGSSASI